MEHSVKPRQQSKLYQLAATKKNISRTCQNHVVNLSRQNHVAPRAVEIRLRTTSYTANCSSVHAPDPDTSTNSANPKNNLVAEMDSNVDSPEAAPSLMRYVIGFLIIGLAWGFTTPFIRAAARTHKPPPHPVLETPSVQSSWIKSKVYGAFFGVVDLLRNPKYAVPLVINLTGSIWFFLLIGKAGKLNWCVSDGEGEADY